MSLDVDCLSADLEWPLPVAGSALLQVPLSLQHTHPGMSSWREQGHKGQQTQRLSKPLLSPPLLTCHWSNQVTRPARVKDRAGDLPAVSQWETALPSLGKSIKLSEQISDGFLDWYTVHNGSE